MQQLVCPRCGAPMEKSIAFNGGKSEFWYNCTRAPACNTYFNSFRPMEHQYDFLRDGHKFKLNAGGFGSAKTYATRQFIYKQLFMNPYGQVLVGANVSSQYENTIKKELEADIPAAFVKRYSAQKQTMELYNGCRLIYRPFDDEGKIRSLNLSAWVIIEASEVDVDFFTQLKSRLRNMNAAIFSGYDKNGRPIFKYFRGQGIAESNPEAGWLREEYLKPADEIYQHGTAIVKYEPDPNCRDYNISVHISSTDANTYLPETYIQDLCKNKPQWWIDRYLFGSFEFANGLVVPNYKDLFIPYFEPPKNWVRLIAHDPGISDPAGFVCAAVDDKNGIVYIYRDLQYKDMGVNELYEKWLREITFDITMSQLYTQPILDPKLYGRRQVTDLQTYDQMWAQHGVFFQPGHISIDDRIFRLITYAKAGRLKIMDNCFNLKFELSEYKWEVKKDKSYKQKPVDKNNHSIDPLEWILMKLPEDPSKLMLGAYSNFTDLNNVKPKEDKKNWMFTDNKQDYDEPDTYWQLDTDY